MIDWSYKWRVFWVALFLVLAWAGLGARLVFLHLGPNEGRLDSVEKNRRLEQEIPVGRGRILDRRGNPLALDLAVKNVCADPKTITENGRLQIVSAHLARLLQMDPAMVLTRLNRPERRYECIKQFVQEDMAGEIMRLQLDGVFLRDASTRYYPHGAMMCHVLGFSNQEGVGSAGIEQKMNYYLQGRPGLRVGEKDGHKREVFNRRKMDIPPEDGCDIELTLDQNIQYWVEKAIEEAVNENHAAGAWAVVERVRTGEILAMACQPAYDLNEYRTTSTNVLLNRAIGYVYEPGSTFKVAVIAAALNEGSVSPERVFDCENGCWYFQGRPLHDYHPYGLLSVADILKKSSNIGAAKVALTLGEARFEKYLRAFGIGAKTGIGLPGEEYGILHNRSRWTSLSLSRMAMGHEVGVTSIQMLNMLCALANDGFLMRPIVVRRILDSKGRTVAEFQPEVVGRPIRTETARLMQRLLARVTEEGGTGTRARVEGYSVGGKTGTAQKPIPGGYSDDKNIASFMGFLPAESPEIAIMVVVDEPQDIRTGGAVAGPVFKRIAEQVVRYLDIPPADAEPVWVNERDVPGIEDGGASL